MPAFASTRNAQPKTTPSTAARALLLPFPRLGAPTHPLALLLWSTFLCALSDSFKSSCMQSDNAFTVVPFEDVSEDCLYLNVFTPTSNNDAGLPVMLFFYGGSWDTGSASSPLYWGEHLMAEGPEGAVVVTANYRLNVFGFLGGEVLRDEEGSTGNWGLRDQRRAMQWVQENIAGFGGDPSRVTIFGESAGAGSVAAHLSSPRSYAASPALFHSAIMESGSPGTPWSAMNMSFAEAHLLTVATSLGCLQDDGAAADVACMRGKSTDEIMEARKGVHAPFIKWAPVVDGVELTATPEALTAQGALADVPVLLGTNGDEGSMFVDIDYDASEADYEAYMVTLFGEELADKVIAQYPYAFYNQAVEGHKAG